MNVLDLFAGPGGWDVALRDLGHDALGVEFDDAACATRAAAGLATRQADVAALDPAEFALVDGLIASPPCQAWSMAGKRGGERDKHEVIACAHEIAAGNDTRAERGGVCEDSRSLLVVEPLRYIRDLRPSWVALEQVPPVLELWSLFAGFLSVWGYRTWTGILSAERYGVPQTRRRAILMARLDGPVAPPPATHQAYVPGEPARHELTLEGEILPWISMAEALGWGATARPYPVIASGRSTGGPDKEKVGGSGAREQLYVEQAEGRWVHERPATTIAGSNPGVMNPNGGGADVPMSARGYIPFDRSRPVEGIAFDPRASMGDGMIERHGPREPVPASAPAPHITTKTRSAEWVRDRPATTVAGRPDVFPPGHKINADDLAAGRSGQLRSGAGMADRSDGPASIRVTEQEAAVLQSFPPDYPWQGSRTKRFEQIGNAVPPLLARAVLGQLVEPVERRAAA